MGAVRGDTRGDQYLGGEEWRGVCVCVTIHHWCTESSSMSNVLNDPQSQTTANWVRAVNWLYPFTKVVEASLRSLLKREDFSSVALVCIPGISAQAAQGFPLAFFATLCSPMRQLMQRDNTAEHLPHG